MRIGQLIPGLFFTFLGIVLLVVFLLNGFQDAGFILLFYGFISLVIGVVILVNSEDSIEKIRKKRKTK